MQYEERIEAKQYKKIKEASNEKEPQKTAEIIPLQPPERINIPYFSDLKIACGHFKSSFQDEENVEYVSLLQNYDHINPVKHFIAKASGNSMNGGKNPIKDRDYLLLELITPDQAGSISNQLIVIERQDVTGDDQFLLRYVKKLANGQYELIAFNPDYSPMIATAQMKTFARCKNIISPDDLLFEID